MFRNSILMGSACATAQRLRTALNAAKFSTVLLLILSQNVWQMGCQANGAAPLAAGVSAALDTHRLAKRMDLEQCLGHYEVHKNTIIRTGESQALGGKYLQGLELDTAEECERLCCETESCDVYIFENKSDGYCYLFECGPQENFHCKFTRHANYTSAVLTVERHFAEVTTMRPILTHSVTNNISQQELELTNLKGKPETTRTKATLEGVASAATNDGATLSASTAMAGAAPAAAMKTVAQPETAFPPKVASVGAHCGRFQFTCHSGECIAVYNACDGIPQCEDGSDEGPECPGATSTAKSNADGHMLTATAMQKPQRVVVPQYQTPLLQQTVQQQLQSVNQAQQQQQQQQQLQQQIHSALTVPLANNREDPGAWANRKVAAEAQHAEQAATKDMELNSRIFSHKGGLQLPTAGVVANVNANSNSNTNTNAAILNTYTSDADNNANINLNAVYSGVNNLQHNGGGLYIPQLADVTAGGVYVPQQQQQQQQQYMLSQAHLLLPSNVQWQMQQQQPAQQTSQTLTAPLQSGPAYIINAAEQQTQRQQSQLTTAIQTKTLVDDDAAAATATATRMQQSPQIESQSAELTAAALPMRKEHTAAVNKAAAAANVAGAATDVDVVAANSQAGAKQATNTAAEYEYDDYEEEQKSTEPPKKKQRKHKKLKTQLSASPKAAIKSSKIDPIELALEQQKQHAPAPSPVHEQYKMIHENLAMEFRDHDGQSERPGGAMLSLTLGLLVTAALAILIGCRMRTVGRRTRRMGGKTPYSHEADFLVNGMYL